MGDPQVHDEFLNVVYEAAVDETLWPSVLERLADLVGADSAALRQYNINTFATRANVTARVDPAMVGLYVEHFQYCNPLNKTPQVNRASMRTWMPTILRDVDWLPKAEFLRTEFYNDFFKPFDVHSDVAIGLAAEGEVAVIVNVLRSERWGEWTAKEIAVCAEVQPHLIRAFKLGQRIGPIRRLGKGLADVLDRSPYGLMLLDRDGVIRYLNSAAEALLARPGGLSVIGGRLWAACSGDTQRLWALIAAANRGKAEGREGGSMALPSAEGLLPFSILIAPLAPERCESLTTGPAVIVCVTDLEAGLTVPEQRLRETFRLSPAESRIVACLLEGLDPNQAADRLSLGIRTVRFHLSNIFQKTSTHSQAELARLMMRTIGLGLN
jgi:DNA-binding CsgD family transcriptional regulator/PAS domain-containing protein